jgi:porin
MKKLIITTSTMFVVGLCCGAESAGLLPIPDYSTNFMDNSYILGDLGGLRTSGAEKGIQADIQWTQIGQSVTDGGRETGSAYGGNLDYTIKLDFDKMGLIPGGGMKIRMESRYGESVNGTAGPLLPVNMDGMLPLTDELDENIGLALTSFFYTQFLSEQFALIAGKIDTIDGDPCEFASGRGTRQFMNFNFNFSATAALMPYSTLALGGLAFPSENVTVTFAVATLQDASTSSAFDDLGDGWLGSVEFITQHRLGELPGGVNLGAVYAADGDFARMDKNFTIEPGNGLDIATASETWTVYGTLWQYLYTEADDGSLINVTDGRPDREGLGIFSRVGIGDEKTTPARFSASIGLGGRGAIPRRDNDHYGLGFYYLDISNVKTINPIELDDSSSGVEFFYSIYISPAMALTLDAQYVTSPGPLADDATVLGARLNLVF